MKKLIYCKYLIDCETDRYWEKEGYYLSISEEGVILAADESRPAGEYQEINWEEYTVMPGLINCHTHITMLPTVDNGEIFKYHPAQRAIITAQNLQEYIETGVTTIRDMGGYDGVDIAVRDFVRDGRIVGPDIYVSGNPIVMTGGHAAVIGVECDGEQECIRAARRQMKAGVDVLKVMATGGVLTRGVEPGAAQLDEEEIAAVCREAHKTGRRVAAHAQGNAGIWNALRAGVDSIEHGFWLDWEAVIYMKEHHICYVPTLCAPYYMRTKGVQMGLAEEFVRKVEESVESHRKSLQMAMEAGVTIAVGTDASTPFNTHRDTPTELRLMCEYGMDNYDALLAATRNAADCIGLEDRGVIAAGKRADLIAVKGNPVKDITVLNHIEHVMKKGELQF